MSFKQVGSEIWTNVSIILVLNDGFYSLNSWGWTFWSLLVARCLLLIARSFLLVTLCSLLVTFCSLLFARCLLLFARYLLFFRPTYCEIKLRWTRKKWFDYNETPSQIFSLQISEIFVTFSPHAKPFSKLA